MKYLFLGGPARSGTTALVKLMNQHPGIALGVERYKYLYGNKLRQDEVGPDLFERDRFFAFDMSETNVRVPGYGPGGLEQLERKFDNAQFRGDKLPSIIKYTRVLNERLNPVRYIFIFRDVERMCSSWNMRAQKEGDAWPEQNDFKQAVKSYNHLLKLALRYNDQNAKRYTLVSYEKLFGSEGEACLVSLLQNLGLKPHPDIMKYLAENDEKYLEISNKPLLELAGQKKYIQSKIDWNNVTKLQSRFI